MRIDVVTAARSEVPAPRAASLLFWLLLALLTALLACGPGDRRKVYFGGPILTLDEGGRVAEALGVEADRIGAVGSLAEVEAWAGAGALHVDLAGHALLPGFIDAHGHFPGAGLYVSVANLNSPPIGPAARIEDLLEALRARAAQTDADDWIVGMGYDDTLLAERRHPTRSDLDRVSSSQAVAALHVSGHLVAVNSVALERLGIDAGTPDPEGGLIRREEDGRSPNGVLEEAAREPVLAAIGQPSLLDGYRILKEASRLYLAAGVTTAQMGMADAAQIRSLGWASRLGLVPLRLVVWPSGETAEAILAGELELDDYDPAWFHVGAVKLMADGSIQGYTGYLSRPYHVPPGSDPGYRGYPRLPADALRAQVERLHRAGHQIAVHGNGDAAIDDILDAFEHAAAVAPRQDARHVVIHAQMARDDQLDRMARLGVIPSFFSLHTYYWGDRHRTIFMGPQRAAHMSPAASAARRHIAFTIHTDTPVVPMEPLRLVWSAVQRRTRSGFVVGAAERISPELALRAVTINAARQHFEEADKGSLEVGKLADMAILSASPLDGSEPIDSIRVLETIVGGRTVHRAE